MDIEFLYGDVIVRNVENGRIRNFGKGEREAWNMTDVNYVSTRIAVWKVKSAWDVSKIQWISIKE